MASPETPREMERIQPVVHDLHGNTADQPPGSEQKITHGVNPQGLI